MSENESQEPNEAGEAAEAARPGAARMTNPLSKPTDAVSRPGFRNAANKGSKAQKKNKKKK